MKKTPPKFVSFQYKDLKKKQLISVILAETEIIAVTYNNINYTAITLKNKQVIEYTGREALEVFQRFKEELNPRKIIDINTP